jgi:hypothetical protein
MLSGCGSKEPQAPAATGGDAAAPAAADATTADAAAPADTAPPAPPLASTDQTWTPEEMEALLAPIALYPDPVLSQVLLASTNPQEVLDAGNWLVENPDVKDKALDQAAEKAGFTPPMRAIMQFRQIVDQMCLEMGWTAELGQAFTNDESGVFAAVQRLRTQAKDVGNLQSSEQMKVEEKTQDGEQAIVISPPSPQVVYVPQYDPVAAYAPPPAAPAAPVAAPATTTTTTTTTEEKGHSTESMVATGLLAFGAGLVVANIFDDDDDDYYHHSNYYPNYYGGYMPPPPPYYYRPVYGNGYHPGYSYNRPTQYNNVLSNNNVVVVNNQRNKNYWNSYNDKPTGKARTNSVQSPITQARPNRSEIQQGKAKPGGANARTAQRPSSTGAKPDWKGQSTYAGAKPEVRAKAKLPESKAATSKAAANATAARAKAPQAKAAQSAQNRAPARSEDRGRATSPSAGSMAESRPQPGNLPSSRPANLPSTRPADLPSSRPASTPPRPQVSAARASGGGGGLSGGNRSGAADRAASQRGRSSMPQGAHSKGAAKQQRR